MRAWTDDEMQRHYRIKDSYGDVYEVFEGSGFLYIHDVANNKDMELDQKKAAKLAKLLTHFAEFGTLPVPKKQKPPKEKKD